MTTEQRDLESTHPAAQRGAEALRPVLRGCVGIEYWAATVLVAARVNELEAALEHYVEAHPNCVRIQAQLDRGQQATAGTCLWDDIAGKLLPSLPTDACFTCRFRAVLRAFRGERP